MKMGFISSIVSYALAIFMLIARPISIHGAPLVPALFAFGDSVVDPGNNNNLATVFKCNFAPYGQDFVGKKATGRFSDGKIATDFLASKLGVKEYLPAYSQATKQDLLTGVSFASGGSGYDNITSQLMMVTSLSKQIEEFKEYKEKLKSMVGEKKAASIIADSIFVVCAGSNDVVIYFTTPVRKSEFSLPHYADFLTRTSSNFTKELIKLGARKILVWGFPPTGCLPFQRTVGGGSKRDCAHDSNKLARLCNSRISRELQRLSSSNQGVKLVNVDIYAPLLDIIEHPKKYGFEESSKGCCGSGNVEGAMLCNKLSETCENPSSYIFWDSFHPTEKANQVLVDQIAEKYWRYIF